MVLRIVYVSCGNRPTCTKYRVLTTRNGDVSSTVTSIIQGRYRALQTAHLVCKGLYHPLYSKSSPLVMFSLFPKPMTCSIFQNQTVRQVMTLPTCHISPINQFHIAWVHPMFQHFVAYFMIKSHVCHIFYV